MKRCFGILLCVFAVGAAASRAQVVESAKARQLTVSAGGFVSGFEPGYEPDSHQPLIGLGTYVDVHFSHWIQIEGEGRWLNFNQFQGEHQSTYLIGPRVPLKQFGRAELYGKALIGLGKMTYPYNYGYGSFTALAFGGTLDYKLSRKLTFRAVDFEYQDWLRWLDPNTTKNTGFYPYGVSVGMAYRVF